MNKSTLKTKMRRAGFRNSPSQWTQWNFDGTVTVGLHRQAWRNNWMYCKGFGRHFRVRWHAGVVDVGEVYETFDRWANSTERTLSVDDFVKEFL
jgi:hypothetical protein